MILGGFGKISDYDKIKHGGFDYAELDMPEIEALTEKEFGAFLEHISESGFPVLTGARILPVAEPMFFMPHYREKDWIPYLKNTCRRAGQVGMKKILFGNGKARWLVEEDSLSKEYIFVDFLRMLCEIAGENGMEVLIEPLGPKYSNYINTLPEAARVIELADAENLFAMADLRHLVWSEEPFINLEKHRDIVHHVHIDYPLSYPERRYPNVRDGYDYAAFLRHLKGYEGTLTIEADIPMDWDAAGCDARELLAACAEV